MSSLLCFIQSHRIPSDSVRKRTPQQVKKRCALDPEQIASEQADHDDHRVEDAVTTSNEQVEGKDVDNHGSENQQAKVGLRGNATSRPPNTSQILTKVK